MTLGQAHLTVEWDSNAEAAEFLFYWFGMLPTPALLVNWRQRLEGLSHREKCEVALSAAQKVLTYARSSFEAAVRGDV